MTRLDAALTALVLSIAAPGVDALSCPEPDAVRYFQDAARADEAYIVLLGRFDFDNDALFVGPRQDSSHPPPVVARFVGKALTAEGFTDDYVAPVTLQQRCMGPHCGGFTFAPVLAFVRLDAGAAVLQIDACSSRYIGTPTVAEIAAIEACMAGTCPPQ